MRELLAMHLRRLLLWHLAGHALLVVSIARDGTLPIHEIICQMIIYITSGCMCDTNRRSCNRAFYLLRLLLF